MAAQGTVKGTIKVFFTRERPTRDGKYGFGYISREDGPDAWFHVGDAQKLLAEVGENELKGKPVIFDLRTVEGRIRGVNLRLASDDGTITPELLLSGMSPTEPPEETEDPIQKAGRLVRSNLTCLIQAGLVAVVWDEDVFQTLGRDQGIFCLDGWLAKEAGEKKWGKILITPEGRWQTIIKPPFGKPFATSLSGLPKLISWFLRAFEEMGIEVVELWEEFPRPKIEVERNEESRQWHHQQVLERARRIAQKYSGTELQISDQLIEVVGVHGKRAFSVKLLPNFPWVWDSLTAKDVYERHLAKLEGTHRPGSLVRLDQETGTIWVPKSEAAAEIIEKARDTLAEHWAETIRADFWIAQVWWIESETCQHCGKDLLAVETGSATDQTEYDEINPGRAVVHLCPVCGVDSDPYESFRDLGLLGYAN